MRYLVYMYYTHSCYQTSIFGKNCAYYIRIFTGSQMARRYGLVGDELRVNSAHQLICDMFCVFSEDEVRCVNATLSAW